MNREIKFKVWLPSIRKMTHPLSPEEWTKCAPFGCDPVWLQYTGFKDSKEREIYEADVLMVIKDGLLQYRKVYFDKEFAAFMTENITFENDTVLGFSWLSSAYDFKIIGNIYENPELTTLKKHK